MSFANTEAYFYRLAAKKKTYEVDSDEEDIAKEMTYDRKRDLSLNINKLPGQCCVTISKCISILYE